VSSAPESVVGIWIPGLRLPRVPRLPAEEERGLRDLLERCADSGKGFSVSPGGIPFVECAFFAANLLRYLELAGSPEEELRSLCARSILELWKPGSGFGDSEGGEPYVFSTYYALAGLVLLGALEPEVASGCEAFLRRNAAESGGLPRYEKEPPELANCFWGTVAASIVGSPAAILGEGVLSFVDSCRTPEGSYSSTPGGATGRLQPTVEAILVKGLYGAPVENAESLRVFLTGCRREGGRFGEVPGSPPAPRDSLLGFLALHLLLKDGRRARKSWTGLSSRIAVRDLWHAYVNLAIFLAAYGYADT
jgi:hypothetical protein